MKSAHIIKIVIAYKIIPLSDGSRSENFPPTDAAAGTIGKREKCDVAALTKKAPPLKILLSVSQELVFP